jgi:hypothetical protein
MHPPDAVAGRGNANFPDSNTSSDPVPSSQVSHLNLISHVRRLLSQKRANFDFPPSLVFVAPPTENSSNYPLRVRDQLLVPNSFRPLSLVDEDSATVISYEYFLVEHLDVLNALPSQGGDMSALEMEILKDEILDTLQRLDRSKGDEWNKQLCAQLNPGTFIITGKDQRAL